MINVIIRYILIEKSHTIRKYNQKTKVTEFTFFNPKNKHYTL